MTISMTKCASCKRENTLRPARERVSIRSIELVGTAMRCSHCREVFWPQDEMERQYEAAASAIVARGIRDGAQFQLVRKMLQLKATDLGRLLGVRPETISRWERGESPVDRAAAFVLGELYERPRVVRAKLEALAAPP